MKKFFSGPESKVREYKYCNRRKFLDGYDEYFEFQIRIFGEYLYSRTFDFLSHPNFSKTQNSNTLKKMANSMMFYSCYNDADEDCQRDPDEENCASPIYNGLYNQPCTEHLPRQLWCANCTHHQTLSNTQPSSSRAIRTDDPVKPVSLSTQDRVRLAQMARDFAEFQEQQQQQRLREEYEEHNRCAYEAAAAVQADFRYDIAFGRCEGCNGFAGACFCAEDSSSAACENSHTIN